MDVLIVERDDLLGSTIADVLGDEGISAVVLSDEEALALPPGNCPRLIITDMNRGHSENLLGLYVVSAVRGKWPELPVVYLAALWPARLPPQALAESERFLPKPVGVTTMTRTVRELLHSGTCHQ